MLNFKLRKGEIATLLTLGLVLVGTLITLGTSLFVSNKRITTNSKAALASPYCPADGDSSCWIVKCLNGKPGKLQYTASLCNSSMPQTSCQGDSPYSGGGTMVIGKTASDAKVKTFVCAPGNVEVTPTPGGSGGGPTPGTTPSCTDITCENPLIKGTTSNELSYDKNGIYYEGSGCEDAEIGYVGKAQDWCDGKSATGCSEVTCKKATANDPNALSKNIRQKQVGGEIRYYNLDDASCSDAIDPKTTCLQKEKPTCEPISCTDSINNGKTYTGDLFYWSDDPQTFYALGCQTKVKIDKICVEATSANTGGTNIPFELKQNGTTGVKLDNLFCDATNIKYTGSPTQVTQAVTKCTAMGYSDECLKIVGSDKGWDVKAPYLYCCSDQYDCKK